VEHRQIQRVLKRSTPQESAREAMQRINEIRAARYELIKPNEDYQYDVKSVELMLRELNRMEEEYIQLFLGYRESDRLSYRFYFVPENEKQGFNPIFRFNPQLGVNDSLFLLKETAFITAEKTGLVEDIAVGTSKKKGLDGLAYCVPEKVNIRIIWNNNVLATGSFHIPQMGVVRRFSSKNSGKLHVSFDTKTGMLRYLKMGKEKLP
jgi:hypothetical protein